MLLFSFLFVEVTSQEPLIDSNSIIKVTSNPDILKEYEHYPAPVMQPSLVIDHFPQVQRITPIAKKTKRRLSDIPDTLLSDDYYLKRHRRHEKEEKTQKNREKERLKHGYYQQKQLVERIKTMDKSLLQSIVSSIRHRTLHQQEGEDDEEEEYLDELHCRLLNDALDHLRRYELLGLNNNKQEVDDHEWLDPSPVPTPTTSNTNTKFQQALQSEAVKQRSRQLKSFSNQPIFAGDSLKRGARRSTRHVFAFGQKLPEFDFEEFNLPYYILDWKKKL